jgi:hypothetical protein
MLVSREGNLVTLINVFETKPEQQQVYCFPSSSELQSHPIVTRGILSRKRDRSPGRR